MEKIKYFEAFVFELLNWYKQQKNSDDNNLSRLKVLKLLFLGVSNNEDNLNIFNNFVSWKFGPVEKEIYNIIKNDGLKYLKVTSNKTIYKNNYKEIVIEDKHKNKAEEIINFLKEKNKDLISYSASTLVDITHKWDCWKLTQKMGVEDISKELILLDDGFFNI